MKKLITILLILLSTSCYAINPLDKIAPNDKHIRVVTEASYIKQINDNSGLELLIKASMEVVDNVTIKIGLSEGYTGFRAKPFNFNHAGTRMDVGVYWYLFNEFQLGYTHSNRKWFGGANPVDIFDYDSVDIISIRKEFKM